MLTNPPEGERSRPGGSGEGWGEKLWKRRNEGKRAGERRVWNLAAPSKDARGGQLSSKRPFVNRSLATLMRLNPAIRKMELLLGGIAGARRDSNGHFFATDKCLFVPPGN